MSKEEKEREERERTTWKDMLGGLREVRDPNRTGEGLRKLSQFIELGKV